MEGRKKIRHRSLVLDLLAETASGVHSPLERRSLHDVEGAHGLPAAGGTRTLRYGWRAMTVLPCETAGHVGRLLRLGGWDGSPVRCGPDCRLPAP